MIGDATGLMRGGGLLMGQAEKVDPVFFHQWMISLGAIALIFLAIHKVAEIVRGKPPTETVISPSPLKMEKVNQLATKEELHAVEKAIEKDIEELRASMVGDKHEAGEQVVRIHNRIDSMATRLGELTGEMKQISLGVKSLVDVAMKPRDGKN